MSERSTSPLAPTAAALPSNTVSWLDLVRALSAQLVLLAHLELLRNFEQKFLLPQIGSLAVIMFYVLSGFLIARSLYFRYFDPAFDFTHYFIDRFCRIYPAYLAALIFVAAADGIHRMYYPLHYFTFLNGLGDASYTIPNFVATALMVFKTPFLGSVVGSENLMIFGSANQFWSLPVEWWLYLTVGYLVLTLKRRRFTVRDLGLLLIFAYIPFFFMFQGNPVTGEGMAAVWLMGAIASFVYMLRPVNLEPTHIPRLLALGAVVLGLSTVLRYQISGNPFDALGAFNLTCLFLLSLWLVQHPFANVLSFPPVRRTTRFLAAYSYSLYLTHHSLIGLLGNFSMPVSAKWLICNLFAIAFAYHFEKPHRRWASMLHAWRARRAQAAF